MFSDDPLSMILVFKQYSKGHTRVPQQCLDSKVVAKGKRAGPITVSARVALL